MIGPGVAGVPGRIVTAKVLAALVPHEFPAATVMIPLSPSLPEVTVIELVVEPSGVMLHPDGTVQV